MKIGSFCAIAAVAALATGCVSNSKGFFEDRFVYVKPGMTFSQYMKDVKNCRYEATAAHVGPGFHGDGGTILDAIAVAAVSSSVGATEKANVERAEAGCMSQSGYRHVAFPPELYDRLVRAKEGRDRRALVRSFFKAADFDDLEPAEAVKARLAEQNKRVQ